MQIGGYSNSPHDPPPEIFLNVSNIWINQLVDLMCIDPDKKKKIISFAENSIKNFEADSEKMFNRIVCAHALRECVDIDRFIPDKKPFKKMSKGEVTLITEIARKTLRQCVSVRPEYETIDKSDLSEPLRRLLRGREKKEFIKSFFQIESEDLARLYNFRHYFSNCAHVNFAAKKNSDKLVGSLKSEVYEEIENARLATGYPGEDPELKGGRFNKFSDLDKEVYIFLNKKIYEEQPYNIDIPLRAFKKFIERRILKRVSTID